MRLGTILCWSALLALTAACGGAAKSKGLPSGAAASGGKDGAGGVNAAGSDVTSGAAGEGGTPEDAGASGGRGGAPFAGSGGAGSAGVSGSTGGASSGGPSIAGAPGAGAPSIAVPEGCVPLSQHTGGLFCSSEMTCDAERTTVACVANDAGVWSCSCIQGETRADFEFPDTTGTRTCEVAAAACLHPELFTDDEICTVTDEVNGQSCSVLDTCRRETEVGGVEVSRKSEFTAECTGVHEALSGCTCPGSRAPAYWLPTNDLSAGCGFLSSLCRGDVTPTGNWTCESLFEDSAPTYGCHSGASCQRPVTLGSGLDLMLAEQYNLNCWDADGVTRCSCDRASGFAKLSLLHGMAADDIASCQLATAACAEVEALELRGSPECTATTDTESSTGCVLRLDCAQAATTQGTEVTVLTRKGATCDLRSDGGWSCVCYGAEPEPVTVELDADDSASACTRATERCPSRSTGYE